MTAATGRGALVVPSDDAYDRSVSVYLKFVAGPLLSS